MVRDAAAAAEQPGASVSRGRAGRDGVQDRISQLAFLLSPSGRDRTDPPAHSHSHPGDRNP